MGEAVRLLEAGLDSVLSEEGFRRYLEVQSRFWEYSYNNCLLIASQRPDATQVMGYGNKEGTTGWKSIGRQVKKGEKAIKIFFPKFGKVTNPETGEEERGLVGFGLGNVFDVAQTEGEPLPERPPIYENTDRTEVSEALNLKLARFAINEGIRCETKEYPGRSNGYFSAMTRPPEIVIRKTAVDPLSVQKTKTLAHEVSHYVAGHGWDTNRPHAELVAEASSFGIMHHYGLDSGGYSFAYLANWGADREKLKAGLLEIQQTAQAIIRGVEGIQHPLDEGDLLAGVDSVKGDETPIFPQPPMTPPTA